MGLLEVAKNIYLTFAEQASTPATPDAGHYRLFFDDAGQPVVLDDAGDTTAFATQEAIDNATDGLPRGELDYAQRTSSQNGIGGTVTDISDLTVSADFDPDRVYRITSFVRGFNTSEAGLVGEHQIYNQTDETVETYRRFSTSVLSSEDAYNRNGGVVSRRVTGLSGAKEFRARARALTTAGTSSDTIDVTAGSDSPAYIMIEDLGAA